METPTLITIHGIIGSLRYFGPNTRMPRLRAVTGDLLGYGRYSEARVSRLTLSTQADHVVRWIDEVPDGDLWLLGHSMGGAIAVLAAEKRLPRIRGVINVEGNLSEKDTFWSSKIATTDPHQWAERYQAWVEDPSSWLTSAGIEPNPERAAWAKQLLENQPASTLYHMSKAILAETLCPEYLETVRRLLDDGLTMHLIAGAKSADGWGVPEFVRDAAASYTEQPDTGHCMMLEAPDQFCAIVESIVAD